MADARPSGTSPRSVETPTFNIAALQDEDSPTWEREWARVHQSCMREIANLAEGKLRGAADDVVQETFFRAWKSIKRYDGSAPLRSWLLGIARHVIIDMIRHQLRRPTDDSVELDELPARDSVAETERRMDRESAEKNLTPALREAFDLIHIKGNTIADAAKETGRTEASVKQSAMRARERLREDLK